jgi:signal transduction histidine kinase
VPNEDAQLRDALIELANLRHRDERLRRASDATAVALQTLSRSNDPRRGPQLLLDHLAVTLQVSDVALCSLSPSPEMSTGGDTSPDFAEFAELAALRDYLSKREVRAVAEPSALVAALSLPKSVDAEALLSGLVVVPEVGPHLVICAGSRDLLSAESQDLLSRFMPLFAQAVQRRLDSLRAAESEARERTLRIAKEAAERANAAKTEFVSRMSHELRTPLNAILGFTELLEGELADPTQRDYLQLIDSSGKHLLMLINSVLDYSQIESGALHFERVAVDLRHEIDAVCATLVNGAASNGTTLSVNVDASVPAAVVGDPVRIREVLSNLIGNAVKFTEHGIVDVTVDPVSDGVRIAIADTGIGMTPEALERAFQPFAQGESSHASRFGGVGLGLVIARDLVHAMGGSLGVVSEVGQGTTVTVTVPTTAG